MKKNNKGFTIVELVIVIAVIAILAAVLIPTFSNVIDNARKSSAMQAARNEFELYIAENVVDLTGDEDYVVIYEEGSQKYAFYVTKNQFNGENVIDMNDSNTSDDPDMTEYCAFDLTKEVKKDTGTTTKYKDKFGKEVYVSGTTTGTYYTQADGATDLEGFSDKVQIYMKK